MNVKNFGSLFDNFLKINQKFNKIDINIKNSDFIEKSYFYKESRKINHATKSPKVTKYVAKIIKKQQYMKIIK